MARPAVQDPGQPKAQVISALELAVILATGLVLLGAAFGAYWRALRGPFVFDDLYLPFADPLANRYPVSVWLRGTRPVVMLTYWANYHWLRLAPFSYHLVNLLFHITAGTLVYAITVKLLRKAGTEDKHGRPLALFAAALFLLHPVQTEAVAYVAARPETISAVLVYGGFALYLCGRDGGLSFLRSSSILGLFVLACFSKEHALALPAVCWITEVIWPVESIEAQRRNRRFHAALIGVAAALAIALTKTVILRASSAGFHLPELRWYEYLFTQGRAVWIYLRLFLIPMGQNADYDFPVSRTILDRGAIVGMAAMALLVAVAVLVRRRRPLAAYGFLIFCALLAPTSSFVPIADLVVERRLYVPSIGLLLVLSDALRGWPWNRRVLAAGLVLVLAAAAVQTYRRNEVWSSALALWEDTARKSPAKFRPRFQLAYAYTQAGRCSEGIEEYRRAARLGPKDYRLLTDSALAYECAGRSDQALSVLREAAAMNRTAHVYSLIGVIHAKRGDAAGSLDGIPRSRIHRFELCGHLRIPRHSVRPVG